MLPLVPWTVTVPDSEVVVVPPPPPPPPLPPQLIISASKHASMAPRATCRTAGLHRKDCESRRRKMMRSINCRQAAKPATGHPLNGCFFGGVGKVVAEDAAVMVATTVLLLVLNVPSKQVTPARVLETLQEKVMLPEKLLVSVRVTVDVPLYPGFIVKLLGEALSEKLPGTVVKLNTLDHGPFWPLPEAARACTSQ